MIPFPNFTTERPADRILALILAAERGEPVDIAQALRPIYLDVHRMQCMCDERAEEDAVDERMRAATAAETLRKVLREMAIASAPNVVELKRPWRPVGMRGRL